tara:strand:- start:33796 stop:35748 length:1953 start_codon:yes stop_codon:yes gene_type:complete
MIIATAGHVDHGKTALVRALTGVDTDRLADEKRRGMTIDLGFAYQTLPDGQSLGFVDVPGHQRFVHTMLAGAAGVDFVLLVVAADDGPMPQTAEHLAILNLLGITRGACVITKCDKVPAERVEDVRDAVSAMLAETGLAGAPVFFVATHEGRGIAAVQAHLATAAASHQRAHADGPLRFIIDRAFSVVGSGLVVTGTVVAGRVAVGDRLVVAPGGHAVRVRGLHAQSTSLDEGIAGQRLGINIAAADVDADTVSRGDWLVAADRCQPTLRLDAEVSVLPSEAHAFGPRAAVHLHLGAADIPARIQVLDGDQIEPGARGLVHVILQRPVSAICGDRLILRDRSATRTIGGGRVINPAPPTARVRAPERLERLRVMALGDPATVLLNVGDGIVDVAVFTRAWNLYDANIAALSASVDAVRAGPEGAEVLISGGRWRTYIDDVLHAVAAWHAAHPSAVGMGIKQLHQHVAKRLTSAQFRDVLRAAEASGSVKVTGAHVAGTDFQMVLPAEDAALWERIRPLLAAGGVEPSRVVELADQLKVPRAAVTHALTAAARLGLAHPVAANRFYLPSGLHKLAEVAHSLDGGKGFQAAEFRDASGLGRNLAIEVLEYFDACGVTRRAGDTRTMIADATAIFADEAEHIGHDMDTPPEAG